jgi:hypothetical protein
MGKGLGEIVREDVLEGAIKDLPQLVERIQRAIGCAGFEAAQGGGGDPGAQGELFQGPVTPAAA